MTVQTTTRTITHVADGVQVTFSYNFLVYEATHLFAYDTDGNEVTGFSVVGLGDPVGGSVTFQTAPAAPTITLVRDVPFTQLIAYIQDDPFPSKTHERGLDLLTMMAQQLDEELTRNLLYRITDSPTEAQRTLPLLSDVPDRIFGWDSNGNPQAVLAGDLGAITFTPWGQGLINQSGAAAGRAYMETNRVFIKSTVPDQDDDESNGFTLGDIIYSTSTQRRYMPLTVDMSAAVWAPLLIAGDAAAGGSGAALPVGSAFPLTGSTIPAGVLVADGSTFVGADYPELRDYYSADSFPHGGDITNPQLPDLRGRTIAGMGQGNTAEGGGAGTDWALGQVAGAETHTLTAGEMPAHTHPGVPTDSGVDSENSVGQSIFAGTAGSTGSAGSGGAHNNLGPRFHGVWVIVAEDGTASGKGIQKGAPFVSGDVMVALGVQDEGSAGTAGFPATDIVRKSVTNTVNAKLVVAGNVSEAVFVVDNTANAKALMFDTFGSLGRVVAAASSTHAAVASAIEVNLDTGAVNAPVSLSVNGAAVFDAVNLPTAVAPNAITSAMVQNGAISFAKQQNINQNVLIGRVSGGTGNHEALSVAQFTQSAPDASTLLVGFTGTSLRVFAVDDLPGGGGGSGTLTTVRKNSGANISTGRSRLNLIEGANTTIDVVDDVGGDEVDITITSTAAGGGGGDMLSPAAAVAVGELYVAGDTAGVQTNGAGFGATAVARLDIANDFLATVTIQPAAGAANLQLLSADDEAELDLVPGNGTADARAFSIAAGSDVLAFRTRPDNLSGITDTIMQFAWGAGAMLGNPTFGIPNNVGELNLKRVFEDGTGLLNPTRSETITVGFPSAPSALSGASISPTFAANAYYTYDDATPVTINLDTGGDNGEMVIELGPNVGAVSYSPAPATFYGAAEPGTGRRKHIISRVSNDQTVTVVVPPS